MTMTRRMTPLPWHDEPLMGSGVGAAPVLYGVSNGRKRPVCKVMYFPGSEDPEVLGNRDFILRACNLFPEMVAFVTRVEAELRDSGKLPLLHDQAVTFTQKLKEAPCPR